MVRLGYGVCVGSVDKLERYVLPRINGPLFALTDQTSIAVAYNTILDHYASSHSELDAVVLLHDDLEITDPLFEDKIAAALSDPSTALIGVAGGSARGGLAWWNHNPIGHQRTDVMDIDFGRRSGEVDLLEGSLLVFPARTLDLLRFDTDHPGFHGYDEIALQARYGQVRVVDIDTHHHTQMGFKTEQSQADWLAADSMFRRKWGI